jgi:hypothetical protein
MMEARSLMPQRMPQRQRQQFVVHDEFALPADALALRHVANGHSHDLRRRKGSLRCCRGGANFCAHDVLLRVGLRLLLL